MVKTENIRLERIRPQACGLIVFVFQVANATKVAMEDVGGRGQECAKPVSPCILSKSYFTCIRSSGSLKSSLG